MTLPGSRRLAWLLCLGLFALTPQLALAADEVPSHTPPRLSLAEGSVSFWRPAVGDWQNAAVNLPLAAGDVLATGERSRAELQLRRGVYVRIGSQSELELVSQTESSYRFELGSGVLALHVRSPITGEQVELVSGAVQVRPLREGLYRLERRDGRVRLVTRDGARARVSAGNQERELASDLELVIDESSAGLPIAHGAPPPDEWDTWNLQRSAALLGRGRVMQSSIVGLEELDAYGEWRSVPTYGLVWFPRVPRMWTPYSVGRWIWDPFYGWTWVDAAPWGWAPFHYGRWVWVGGRWGWVLGPPAPRFVYAPALVAFYVGKGVFVGVGTVAPPVVAWVPLSWGEPCLPWWGPAWFVGKPWWGGWHGPRRPIFAGRWRDEHRPPALPHEDFEHARGRRGLRWVASDRFGLFPAVTARTEPVEIERLAFPNRDLPRRPPSARLRGDTLSQPDFPGQRVVPGGRQERRETGSPRAPHSLAEGPGRLDVRAEPRRPTRAGLDAQRERAFAGDGSQAGAGASWGRFAPKFGSSGSPGGRDLRNPEWSRPRPDTVVRDRNRLPRGTSASAEPLDAVRPRGSSGWTRTEALWRVERKALEGQSSARPRFGAEAGVFRGQRFGFDGTGEASVGRGAAGRFQLDAVPRRPARTSGALPGAAPPARIERLPGGSELFAPNSGGSAPAPQRRREVPLAGGRGPIHRTR